MLNGVCKASCPMGYYEDMEEGRCSHCHPTCGSCSGPLADDCETCAAFSPRLYKGSCSKDCPASTYYETEAMECQGEQHTQVWLVITLLTVQGNTLLGVWMNPHAVYFIKNIGQLHRTFHILITQWHCDHWGGCQMFVLELNFIRIYSLTPSHQKLLILCWAFSLQS